MNRLQRYFLLAVLVIHGRRHVQAQISRTGLVDSCTATPKQPHLAFTTAGFSSRRLRPDHFRRQSQEQSGCSRWPHHGASRRRRDTEITFRTGSRPGSDGQGTKLMMAKTPPPPPTWSVEGMKILAVRVQGPTMKIITPRKIIIFLLFQLLYKKALRLLYKLQVQAWRLVRKHDPQPYDGSVLGFLEPRLRMLGRVLVVSYFLTSAVNVYIASGWKADPKLAKVMSDVVYCWYAGYFVDETKRFFLPVWLPALKADKRKGFIYNRSLSVLTWAICLLSVSEIISSYLRIPITSTLAFGGIGGLAIGLAGKDVLSNFFGGLMLLLAEPFIPGDMITFQRGGVLCEGRVERVGWYQTRMRGRDTRPTYVPNGMFVDTLVTNMDRITHRKFETTFQLRYSDSPKVTEILQGIKAALKDVPNIDLLSPFRVHLIGFTETGLQIAIVCYFATKSFDEFLYLQQLGLMEVTRVVNQAGATMTSVMHVDMTDPQASFVAGIQPSIIQSGSVKHQDQAVRRETGGQPQTRTSQSEESISSDYESPSHVINGSVAVQVDEAGQLAAGRGSRPRGGSV